MAFTGLNPDKARQLSAAMRLAGSSADALGSEVTAALTLAELESTTPGQLVGVGAELDRVGVVISARADLAEGFVVDPATLAADLGLTVVQASAAIETLTRADTNLAAVTPLIDSLAENREVAELLRSTFVGLPPLGENAELDQALLNLAAWLPDALQAGELPDLVAGQGEALVVLAQALGVLNGVEAAPVAIGAIFGSTVSADLELKVLPGVSPEAAFEAIEKAFELDSRLATAAGLPTVADIHDKYLRDADGGIPFDPEWSRLDDWLPAYLAGEGEIPDDIMTSGDAELLLEFATATGWGNGVGGKLSLLGEAVGVAIGGLEVTGATRGRLDEALAHLRDGRLLQRSLIPGDFEGIDGPIIVWTEQGIDTSILAGERQGVITPETRRLADKLAETILARGDGSGVLTEEQQQLLVSIVVGQNGQEFVMENPGVQRQIVSALNLIGQQPDLESQQRVLAKTIEAFRSLALVGSPAVTYRQLRGAVGEEVTDELSYKYLTARSEKKVGKRPQFLTLLMHWGIPGSEKVKTKKRKFKFSFDEQGRLTKIKHKKISKWKRFTNTVKAIGKSLWKEWSANPWKYLFLGPAGMFPGANQLADGVKHGDFDDMLGGALDMTKFAATAAAALVPGANAATFAAWATAAIDLMESIDDGDVLGIIGSSLGVVGLAASKFTGSLASGIQQGAEVGGHVVDAVEAGIALDDAIDDGDIAGIFASSFSLGSAAAKGFSEGADLANNISVAVGGADDLVSGDTIDLITQVGTTFDQLGDVNRDVGNLITVIEGDDVGTAIAAGLNLGGTALKAVGDSAGLGDEAIGLVTGGTAEQVAGVTEFATGLGTSLNQAADLAEAINTGVSLAEGDDLIGVLTSSASAVEQLSTLLTDDGGVVADALGLSDGAIEWLRSAGDVAGSEWLTEGGQLTRALVDGDELGMLQELIDLGQLSLDADGRLSLQLEATSQIVDLAQVVETAYRTGATPSLMTLATGLVEVAGAVDRIPPPPPPPPTPIPALRPAELGVVGPSHIPTPRPADLGGGASHIPAPRPGDLNQRPEPFRQAAGTPFPESGDGRPDPLRQAAGTPFPGSEPTYPDVPLYHGPSENLGGLLDPHNAVEDLGTDPGESRVSFDLGGTSPSVLPMHGVTSRSGQIVRTVEPDGSGSVSVSETATESTVVDPSRLPVGHSTTLADYTSSSTSFALAAETSGTVAESGSLPTYDPDTMLAGDGITTTDTTGESTDRTNWVGGNLKNIFPRLNLGGDGQFRTTAGTSTSESTSVTKTDDATSTVETSSRFSYVHGTNGVLSGDVYFADGEWRPGGQGGGSSYRGLRADYDVGSAGSPDFDERTDMVAHLSTGEPQLDPGDRFETFEGRTWLSESHRGLAGKGSGGPIGGSGLRTDVLRSDETVREHSVVRETATGAVEDSEALHSRWTESRSVSGGNLARVGVDYPDVDTTVIAESDVSGYHQEHVEVQVGRTRTSYSGDELRTAARRLVENDPAAADNPVIENILNNNSLTTVFTEREGVSQPTSGEIDEAMRLLSTHGPNGTYDEIPDVDGG